jgi:PAS domain S-box-containing protein
MKNPGCRKNRLLKIYKIPILILLTGILLIWTLYWGARKAALEQLHQQFLIDAKMCAANIQDALQDHLIDLEGLHSFYNASTSVTRKAFAAFVTPTLKIRPGIQAFSWIPRVAFPERARFEAEARRDGLQDYQFFQLDAQGHKVAVGPHQYYYPVYYTEPLAGNKPGLGFDLGSDSARLAALDQAADTGRPVATERLTLVQETGSQAGFLIFIPVYRQEKPLKTEEQRRLALQGFVLGVFRAGDALEAAAVRPSPEKGLWTELVDLYGPLEARLLYRFQREPLPLKVATWKTLLTPAVTLRFEYPFDFAGRQWGVEIAASPAYVQGHISLSYWLTPLIGALLTVSLALFFGGLLSHKVSAYARSLIEASLDPMLTISPDGKIMDVNHATEIVTGVSREELIRQDFSDYCTEPEKAKEVYRQVFSRGMVRDYTLAIRHASGQVTEVTYNASLYTNEAGEVQGVFAAARDITERKRAEEALARNHRELQETALRLEQSMNMLQLIIESIPVRVFWKDQDLRYLGCNTLFARDAGLEQPRQLLGQDDFALVWRDQADRYRADDRQVMESRRPKMNIIEPQTTPTGAKIWLNTSKVPLPKPDGEVFGILGVYEDITERFKAEEALRDSEAKYRSLIDNASEAILLTDIEGNFLEANRKAEELLGYGKAELLRMNVRQVHPEEDLERIMTGFKETIQNGEGSLLNTRVLRKDGAQVPVDITGSTIEYAGKTITQGIIKDIRERQRAEEERLRFSKLESLGTLAGGIAHDFNNILMAILGNIGLAMLDGKISPQVRERLAQSEQACLRAQSLSRQLLTFAKGGAPIKKIVSIAKVIKESPMLTLSGSKSRYEVSIPGDLWPVEGDEGQIDQVVSNLLINADQAMPGGGVIKITAENILVDAKANLPVAPGKYVKFAIADQGVGIPPQYLDKIFDPYFSTKQKGSGLGLARAYSIVKSHSGHLQVESRMGFGTTFHIYLPATDKGAPAVIPETCPIPIRWQGKVLIMDDEEMVREVLGRMLSRLGYEVDFASDGSQAIEKFVGARADRRPFAAVILDLTIPGGMGGEETLENLLRIDPQIKAIVSSGYSDNQVMANFQKYGFREVIAKPYRLGELSKILQRVISEQGEKFLVGEPQAPRREAAGGAGGSAASEPPT